jgi:hypothetical protein
MGGEKLMLARNYRFTAYNACGQLVAVAGIVVKARRWKLDSSGAVAYEASEATVLSNGSAVADGAYVSSSSIDNSTDKYIGGDFTVTFTAPTSASGTLTIYYGPSTDGGTTFPDNGRGVQVCAIPVTTSGTFVKAFSLG